METNIFYPVTLTYFLKCFVIFVQNIVDSRYIFYLLIFTIRCFELSKSGGTTWGEGLECLESGDYFDTPSHIHNIYKKSQSFIFKT